MFWAAHVYAGTVAHHGLERDRVLGVREAFHLALRRSAGLLTSALIPSFLLLLGATEVVVDSTAKWLALWTCVLVLAVLGFIAFTRRGASWPWRIIGALGTSTFGIAMIILKAALSTRHPSFRSVQGDAVPGGRAPQPRHRRHHVTRLRVRTSTTTRATTAATAASRLSTKLAIGEGPAGSAAMASV